MTSFVVVDAKHGSLDRYETGGRSIRKTHACTVGEPVTFGRDLVEEFRTNPPDKFLLISQRIIHLAMAERQHNES